MIIKTQLLFAAVYDRIVPRNGPELTQPYSVIVPFESVPEAYRHMTNPRPSRDKPGLTVSFSTAYKPLVVVDDYSKLRVLLQDCEDANLKPNMLFKDIDAEVKVHEYEMMDREAREEVPRLGLTAIKVKTKDLGASFDRLTWELFQ